MLQISTSVVVAVILLAIQGAVADDDSSEYGVGPGSVGTSCPCGWSNKQFGRVVGGKKALKHEYPFMLALFEIESEEVYCGASILTKRHALTAAHCTILYKSMKLAVMAGAHHMYKATGKEVAVPVKQTVEHESYDQTSDENDIALLILANELTFNDYIGPVCMPKQSYQLVGKYVKVIGWGDTRYQGYGSDWLLKVNLKVMPLKVCHDAYEEDFEVKMDNPTQICTFRRGKDSCQGDSGGPLLYLDSDTNRYVQVAIVSQGYDCGGEFPSLNTDVFVFTDWIKQKIKDSGDDLALCTKL